jgi:FKBP-type peptidyl-prolyl cis-trans isomerase
MAGTAVMAAVSMYTSHKSSQDAKRARESAEREASKARADARANEEKAAAEHAEEQRKLAESTPTGSMSTTSRIAAQRAIQNRRAGTGRAGTVLDTSQSLG